MMWAIFWPPAWALLMYGLVRCLGESRDEAMRKAAVYLTAAAAGVAIADVITGAWPELGVSAGNALTGAFLLWCWRRRRRKGRLAALGAKVRARIAAMAQKMRERPARPALRPVPAGAR